MDEHYWHLCHDVPPPPIPILPVSSDCVVLLDLVEAEVSLCESWFYLCMACGVGIGEGRKRREKTEIFPNAARAIRYMDLGTYGH